MTKREFLKTGLLATGSGLLPTSSVLAGLNLGHFTSEQNAYNGALFPYHWAEDLILLAHLSDLPAEIPQALEVNREYFQLGRSWQITKEEARTVLRESRQLLAADENDLDRAKTQYALVAGWLAARYQEKNLSASAWPRERQLATDAHLLRVLQAGGAAAGAMLSLSKRAKEVLKGANYEDVLELLRLVRQRNLLRLHTFRPEWNNVERWLEGTLANFKQLEANDELLARYYLHPQSSPLAKVNSYYTADDPVVALARSLRAGHLTTGVGQREKISVAKATSPYGKQLAEALVLQEQLGRYVSGKARESELDQALAAV